MTDTRTLTVERSTSTGHRLTHYDGVCNNIHGHNIVWVAEVTVDMADTGADNMPVDLKTISDTIDQVDHALLLNEDDPLANRPDMGGILGTVMTFPGDPTCEFMADWMARRILTAADAITEVSLSVSETDKYAISTTVSESD